jgi:glycosyltransferase involved in cell wall biosynthesis
MTAAKDKAAGFRVLYAGRFDGIKGLPLALEAFAMFRKSHPAAVFEFVGEGPEKDRIEALASRLGLADGVRMIPWLSRPELLRRMRASDVFFFPSLRDGGGAVVIESMASGTPVLCLDIGGPGFHVRPEWGIKISPGDPAAVAAGLAAALDGLARGPERAAELARAGRRRVEDYYLWERLGDRLKKIYDEVRT